MQISFDTPEALKPWRVINDGVMGGLSKGQMTIEGGRLVFDGFVNTNGGGFTSIRRSVPAERFQSVEAIHLRVRPDERDYRLTLRTSQSFRGRNISWQAPFPETEAGEWSEITIPFSTLKPSVFGRSVPSDPFDRTDIRELGVIIADGVDGPFRLEIGAIDCAAAQ